MKTCKQCAAQFEVAPEDLDFYERFGVPEPNYCPSCRRQHLMVWRNERTLYQAKCASCKASMVSCFAPHVPFQVFCNSCWWSDAFDPLSFGKDFDFNRPFFPQFWELMQKTPLGNLFIASSENSEYTNYAVSNKNCYMVTASDYNEDSFYADNGNKNRDVCDVSFVNGNELLYECIDTVNSYHCVASQNLKNCNFCSFSLDLIGCSNCIGCVGLRNKEYFIFNKKLTKEEYETIKNNMQLSTYDGFQKVLEAFHQFKPHQSLRGTNNLNSEGCTGDYIVNSKNCVECFDMYECEECRYSTFGYKTRYAYDIYGAPKSELVYQVAGASESYDIKFCSVVWPGSNDVQYSFLTRSASHCFGCVSLHKNEYCILNKQYTKVDFDKLRIKIIEHMKKTGEWGDFFPMQYAPWSYNETVAYDYYPLTKEATLKLPARWEDELPGTFGKETMKPDMIPGDIREVPNTFSGEIFACEVSSRNYKVIAQELRFYKNISVPFPRKCPSCRYRERLALRNPRKLWKRRCSKCAREFLTTFAPERSEQVFCEECYNLYITKI